MRQHHLHHTFLISILALLMISSCPGDPPLLDATGRALLDPLRNEALQPQQLVARLGLSEDARVADVGAGPGFLTLPLAKAIPRGRVHATDIRADYLSVLEARAREAGLANIETRVVDPQETGIMAASMDLVLLCQVDHLLADRVAYFKKLVVGLRRGGRVVIINRDQYRAAAVAALEAAGLRAGESWQPSPGFFSMIFHFDQGHSR